MPENTIAVSTPTITSAAGPGGSPLPSVTRSCRKKGRGRVQCATSAALASLSGETPFLRSTVHLSVSAARRIAGHQALRHHGTDCRHMRFATAPGRLRTQIRCIDPPQTAPRGPRAGKDRFGPYGAEPLKNVLHVLRRRPIDRTELLVADEFALCGTIGEIIPVKSIDGFSLPKEAPIIRAIQTRYLRAIRGVEPHPSVERTIVCQPRENWKKQIA